MLLGSNHRTIGLWLTVVLFGLLGTGCATTARIHVFTQADGVDSVQPIVDALRHEGLEVEERVITMPKGLSKTALFADDGYQSKLCVLHLGDLVATASMETMGVEMMWGDDSSSIAHKDYPVGDIALYWLESGSTEDLALNTDQLVALAELHRLRQQCD